MRAYELLFGLDAEPGQDAIDRLYAFFGEGGQAAEEVRDFSITSRAGIPTADCTVEARSFEAAVNLVLPVLRKEGIRVVGVEIDAEGLSVLEGV